MRIKILLLGKNGQLGWELRRTLACLGDVTALDYPEVDFTHPDQLADLVRSEKPGLVVNAVAYTAVDRAESEAETARLINAVTPEVLAEAAKMVGAGFIHYSTDYVFDGEKGSPYTESDQTNPLNAYGSTKLGGEQAVAAAGGAAWVFRTCMVFSNRRDSFVAKVLQWSRGQKVLRVVSDQVGSPTWARALAEATSLALAMGRTDLPGWMSQTSGLYHLAGDGSASRLDWAREILALDPHREEQVTESIEPAASSEFTTPARRPLFSALDCQRFYTTFGFRLPPWQVSLGLAMDAPG
jgi:dTDP-4-dehydrorhamnose reductase